jgi:hypothetical protein
VGMDRGDRAPEDTDGFAGQGPIGRGLIGRRWYVCRGIARRCGGLRASVARAPPMGGEFCGQDDRPGGNRLEGAISRLFR